MGLLINCEMIDSLIRSFPAILLSRWKALFQPLSLLFSHREKSSKYRSLKRLWEWKQSKMKQKYPTWKTEACFIMSDHKYEEKTQSTIRRPSVRPRLCPLHHPKWVCGGVYICLVCAHMCIWVHMPVHAWEGQRGLWGVLFYQSLYLFHWDRVSHWT